MSCRRDLTKSDEILQNQSTTGQAGGLLDFAPSKGAVKL